MRISPSRAAVVFFLGAFFTVARADTFGTSGNEFTIDFVTIGNTENSSDDTGFGDVSYIYRMGVFEVSQAQWNKAIASGLNHVATGEWLGNQPAAGLTWYDAAAFVNWLNTSTGKQAAYNLTWNGSSWTMSLWSSEDSWQDGGENRYRHKDAYYFLPNENEWYKAAFYDSTKDDGAGGYWDFATGSDDSPEAVASGNGSGTSVYADAGSSPAVVTQAGGLSPYGTMGQNGNVWEWNEGAYDGVNNDPTKDRALRGGSWFNSENELRSTTVFDINPSDNNNSFGFRVASIPEPSAAWLGVTAISVCFIRKRMLKYLR